jgi:hypothetical protein
MGNPVDDEMALLAARTAVASRRLRDAVAVDISQFVVSEVERRLRSRPNFLARTPSVALASLRRRVDDDSAHALERLAQPIADLRIYYGASDRSAADEDAGFAKTLTEATIAVANRLLSELAFPGDDKPDLPDITTIDLDAEYELRFVPAPSVMWSWRQLRILDTVRNQLVDGKGVADLSFDLRWQVPEHIPPS